MASLLTERGAIKDSRIAPFDTAMISSKSQIATALQNIEFSGAFLRSSL
jgi:hypothetical protein